MKKVTATLLFVILALVFSPTVFSDELDKVTDELQSAKQEKQQKQSELERLQSLKAQYENELYQLQNTAQSVEAQLSGVEQQLAQKEAELEALEEEIQSLEESINQRQTQLKKLIRQLYISDQPMKYSNLLTGEKFDSLSYAVVYNNALVSDARNRIVTLNEEMKEIEEIRTVQEEIKVELESQRQTLVQRRQYLQSTIGQTQQQLTETQTKQQQIQQSLVGLDRKISSLTQKQQQILAEKAAAALKSTSVGNTEVDRAAIDKEPPKDGKVYFSFWTYGYPHRVGMSQYGAYGRSKAGQGYKQILNAYYSNVSIETSFDDSNTIPVQGYGNISMREYLYGLGEMPESWGDSGGFAALKAQAVAARSYALNYIYYHWDSSAQEIKKRDSSSSICTDQNCQVYLGHSKGATWQKAVDETDGEVLTYNGKPITAWYASTSGGFTLSSQQAWGGYRPWVLGISDFDGSSSPYEGPKYGDSPWYHKAWGDEPWLSKEQVVDLFNTALLPEQYDDQVDSLSSKEVVQTLKDEGITPVSGLKSLEVLGAGKASTDAVRAYYNDTYSQVSGSRFKFVFNLRSPGTDAIWTSRFDVKTAAEL